MTTTYEDIKSKYGGSSTTVATPGVTSSSADRKRIILGYKQTEMIRPDENEFAGYPGQKKPEYYADPTVTPGEVISEDLEDWFYSLDPRTELRNLQLRLFQGGFYGNVKWSQIPKVHDENTLEALGVAAERAEAFGRAGIQKTVDNVIDEAALETGSGTEEEVEQIKFSNSEDIANVVRKSAGEILGRKLNDREVQRLVKAYQAAEIADATNQDPTREELVDLDTYAAREIRASNPEEAGAHDFANVAQGFYGLIEESARAVQQY